MLTPAPSSPPLLTKLGAPTFHALLRGLGRQAQRLGTTAAGSVAHAEKTTGPLSSADRLIVMSGWDDESRMGMGVV